MPENEKNFKPLDPLLHSELRLVVMSVLLETTEADFVYLKSTTGATSGNLSVQIDKLQQAGKHFEFQIYPNKNHSIYDYTGQTRLNLYQLMTDFIERKL